MKKYSLSICELDLNQRTGDLMGIKWKDPEIEIIAEPRLGENFRLLLPEPGYEANYFESKSQRVTRIERINDGVTLVYEGLRNERTKVDVVVQYTIRVADGQIAFSIDIENRTKLKLAEVFFGIIGGHRGVHDRNQTKAVLLAGHSNLVEEMYQKFSGGGYGGGNLGIRHSAMGWSYPGGLSMPWFCAYNPKRNVGFYYANHDLETRTSAIYFELRPFTSSATVGENWPRKKDLPTGEPIGLTMGWMNMPYSGRGVHRFGPIVLQAHQGDWRKSSRIYRRWFDRHFQIPKRASWLRREHAWQSMIISNSEDVIVHRFKDLPRLAADAKKYGVTTFEILGWDEGGIDRGYPDYTPATRLGTKKEFAAALRAIRSKGVKPIIFANVQFADTATRKFQQELQRYAIRGRWAEDRPLWGWGEGTMSGRMGLVRSNMTVISPSHPRFRRLLLKQYRDLVRDGAAGLQLDKTCVLGDMDFNPLVPVGPDCSMSQGVLRTLHETVAECRKIDPGFCLASEIWWDRAFTVVDVSYMRMGSVDIPSPVLRYTFPEWTSTIFAENPGDFNVMNNGMRYGFVWAMAPRHYNDSLDEPLTRPLSRYVKELLRIRKRHEDVLFLGRFLDTDGATVKGGTNIRYSVFEKMNGSGKAVVVVNYGDEEATALANWSSGKNKRVEVCQPFQTNRKQKLPVRLRLPSRTCAVIVAE